MECEHKKLNIGSVTIKCLDCKALFIMRDWDLE